MTHFVIVMFYILHATLTNSIWCKRSNFRISIICEISNTIVWASCPSFQLADTSSISNWLIKMRRLRITKVNMTWIETLYGEFGLIIFKLKRKNGNPPNLQSLKMSDTGLCRHVGSGVIRINFGKKNIWLVFSIRFNRTLFHCRSCCSPFCEILIKYAEIDFAAAENWWIVIGSPEIEISIKIMSFLNLECYLIMYTARIHANPIRIVFCLYFDGKIRLGDNREVGCSNKCVYEAD